MMISLFDQAELLFALIHLDASGILVAARVGQVAGILAKAACLTLVETDRGRLH